MSASNRFDEYMEHLALGLGHADRHAGLKGYCTGLMLPVSRVREIRMHGLNGGVGSVIDLRA